MLKQQQQQQNFYQLPWLKILGLHQKFYGDVHVPLLSYPPGKEFSVFWIFSQSHQAMSSDLSPFLFLIGVQESLRRIVWYKLHLSSLILKESSQYFGPSLRTAEMYRPLKSAFTFSPRECREMPECWMQMDLYLPPEREVLIFCTFFHSHRDELAVWSHFPLFPRGVYGNSRRLRASLLRSLFLKEKSRDCAPSLIATEPCRLLRDACSFSLEKCILPRECQNLGAAPTLSLPLEREVSGVCIFSASYRTMQAPETLLLFFFLAAPRHFISTSCLSALNEIREK